MTYPQVSATVESESIQEIKQNRDPSGKCSLNRERERDWVYGREWVCERERERVVVSE